VRHPIKWALLAATILSVLMSWGKYFMGFNNILFDILPLYNKFRAPSMALIIAEFTMPIMAVLTVHQLFFARNAKEMLQADLKKILYTLGGIVVVIGLIYLAQDYSSGFDQQIMDAKFDQSGSIRYEGRQAKHVRRSGFTHYIVYGYSFRHNLYVS
ncbi:MAG TPA: hypothetical protein PLS00_03755, partial [Niabella sp.]|nr:hypothetical protein [Niabella sp.]